MRLVATRLRPFSAGEQLALPRMLRTMQADLYHAPYYIRPYAGLPCPSVTTLYDIIPRRFPEEVSPRARRLFDLLTRLAIRASRHLLAISASARDDLIAAYRIPAGRITVTPTRRRPALPPAAARAIAAVRAKYQLPERYILSLASNKPHKNLVPWSKHSPDREIGEGRRGDGKPDPNSPLPSPFPSSLSPATGIRATPQARRAAERLGLGDSVRFLPGVPEADLPALYSGAELFAFPSRYEGFGLPAAGGAGLRRAGAVLRYLQPARGRRRAALRVAPTPAALAAGLAQLLADHALRAELRAAGPRRAALFSWRSTAEATLAVYERVAANVQTFKRSNV